ncbi:MAG: magnesium protoporphyrin IX methyltransferase [Rhodobacteraceae bacterium]|jgi:magnesium-protoporphyrin O-methyltransferase|nr:magnesium protoporphyrin IX methyltransferase [Paracoccaceae bacterium]
MDSYAATRARLEHYFDRTAAATWERLTSDAPVSRVRATVRAGRDTMRAALLARLPDDLSGLRILDAGAGAGQMTEELAGRGAEVVAADISPALLAVARRRIPAALHPRVTFVAGDMLDDGLGIFDAVVAMDSLIHYAAPDIAGALARLARRTRGPVLFTIAPRTPALSLMWLAGKAFPRADRSPAIVPHADAVIARALAAAGVRRRLVRVVRIARGFYISQAMELAA